MRRETKVQLIAGVCLAAFLTFSSSLSLQIAASTGRNRLVYAEKAESGDPLVVSMGVALGAFRGLFVNYLWIRANDLKEAGKYYEAVDLAKTITRFQPRFPKVWQFHAWNLAYNISVSTQTPAERWQWVNSGMRLLRNEGIPANPSDIGIHKELAWILLHKVAGVMDDAHRYYKTQFAIEWTGIMGAPPSVTLENRESGQLKGIYADRWLRPIVNAPDSLAELVKKHPQAVDLIAEIKAKANLDLDIKFLERFAQLAAYANASDSLGFGSIKGDPLGEIMASGKYPVEVGKAVVHFTRKQVLVNEYHMEPARMLRYTEKYGPLDWRLPAAHAVYWSARGSEEALTNKITAENKSDFDLINTDRLTAQAVQELFRTGTLVFDATNPDFYLTIPNGEFIDSYKKLLVELRPRSDFDQTSRAYSMYSAGYENFMKDAIRFLYRRGDKDAAVAYRQELIEWKTPNRNDPYRIVDLRMPIDEWVQREIVDDNRETSPPVALQEITGSLYAAYINGLLLGDGARFNNEFNYARTFHEKYQESQGFKTWVTQQTQSSGVGRLGMPPFDYFASQVLAQLVDMSGIPQGPQMFRRAPADLQARTYVFLEHGRLRGYLDGMAKEHGSPPFVAWFPEPPGVEAFRQEYRSQVEKATGNTELR